MKGNKLILTLFILLFKLNSSSCFIANFQTYVSFAMNFKDKAVQLSQKAMGTEVEEEEYEANAWGDKTGAYLEAIVGKVDKISTALNVMNRKIEKKLEAIETMLRDLPDLVNRQALMNQFAQHADRITMAYKTLQIYAYKEEEITKKRIKSFIEANVASQERSGLEGILGDITSIIISPNNPDNLLAVMERMEGKKYQVATCGRSPPHLILYEFYLTIAGLELLAFSALSTGYGLRELLNPEVEEAKVEINFLQNRMIDRMSKYAAKFSEALNKLYRSHYKCDPIYPERDVTFVEMWGLYGLITHGEYGILQSGSLSCENRCNSYNNGAANTEWCYAKPDVWSKIVDNTPEDLTKCTAYRTCRGKLSQCWNYNTWSYSYCMKLNSTRRYEWLSHIPAVSVPTLNPSGYTMGRRWEAGNPTNFGHKTNCKNGVEDGWRANVVRNSKTCTFCWCICDDNEPDSTSVHTVSLKAARSNTAQDKVVVGARFVVSDNIMHIQVKEGIIAKDYGMGPKKKTWVDLPKMGDNVIKSLKNPDDSELKEDVDFTVIKRGQQAFNFDEIQLPFGEVITGVKFGLLELDEGDYKKRIQIEIESMKYDYKTGKLEQGTEKWTKPAPVDHGSKLGFVNKNPIYSRKKTSVDSESNQYVVLMESDFYTDASQSVLPFFDAESVEANPNTPLAGLGLHHRASDDSAGYLSLTGYTAQFGEFLADSYKEYYEIEKAKEAERRKKQGIKETDDDDEEEVIDI